MRRPRFDGTAAVFLAAAVALVPRAVHAIDHTNLDGGRPVRLEDAYAIAHREWTIEAGFRLDAADGRTGRGVFGADVLFGLLPNLQIGAGGAAVSGSAGPAALGRAEGGRFETLFNLNQESLTLPAIALEGAFGFSSSGGDTDTAYEVTAILTKSLGRVRFHVNGGYEVAVDPGRGEDGERGRLAVGASFAPGAPMGTRWVIVADGFAEESERTGGDGAVGGEAGLRYLWSERIVLDAGIGTATAGGRMAFAAGAGISVAF